MKFGVLHSIRSSRISINTRFIAFSTSTSNRFSYIDADTDRHAHLLHRCANIKSLAEGKQIHTHLIKTALQQDIFLGNHAINMYSKCGVMEDACKLFDKMHQPNVLSWNTMISGYVRMASLEDAEQLFDKMPERDLVSWNAMLAGYSRHGRGDKAWRLFYQMKLAGTTPDQFTYSTVLSSCANPPPFEEGKQIHSQVIQTGLESNVYVSSALVNMYSKCRNIEDAHRVFQEMTEKNFVSWNAMIAGFARCGRIQDARRVFDEMPVKSDVSWSAMLAGYAQNGNGRQVMDLFSQMLWAGLKPNEFAYASVVNACTMLPIQLGKQIHALLIRSGFGWHLSVTNALITMYGKEVNIEDACKLFGEMPERNAVSWNAMIAAYAQQRLSNEALQLFRQMLNVGIRLDEFTIASILSVCACLLALQLGKQLHAHIVKSGLEPHDGNAVVDMYAKCLCLEDAHKVFDRMNNANAISWNAMIVGCTVNDQSAEALKLFCQMQKEGMQPDEVTFGAVMSACASLAALELGKQIHMDIIRTGMDSFVCVSNSLVTMYAKCGILDDARRLFDAMPEKDVVSWNAIIAGYAQHGCGTAAQQLFEQMLQVGIKPDCISFTGVLSACSYAGLIDEGYYYFNSMYRDHSIMPEIEHYACMIDFLGRAGHLDAAKHFIDNMPFEPDAILWATLLNASRIHGNTDLGQYAAECLFKLEPNNPSTYVLLSNIYAVSDRWDDVARVRKMMKDKGVKKKPGCSWIEVGHQVHAFMVGDRSHPQTEEIYATLERLACQMRDVGYVPDKSFGLQGMEEQ